MKRPESVRCSNCMFVAKRKDGGFSCRFFPPVTIADEEGSRTWSWPKIAAFHWCGQFKPADNLTAIEWVAWQKGLEEDVKA